MSIDFGQMVRYKWLAKYGKEIAEALFSAYNETVALDPGTAPALRNIG